MKSVLAVLGTRRKAIAAVLGVASELVAEAIPQTNPQNALVLHSVLAVITVWMVHATPNDPPIDSISEFVDDLVKGDPPKHIAAPQG